MSLPLVLRALFWTGVYGLVTVAPLIAARLGTPVAGKGWVTDFSIALGFVGLAIMMLQFGLVARFQKVAAPFGMDSLHQFHRQIAAIALIFVLAHPTLLLIEDPGRLGMLNPMTAPGRARFGLLSVALLLILAGTSLLRKKLRLSYEVWQFIHGLLAIGVVGCAMAHMLGWDHYMAAPWQRGLWMVMGAVLLAIVAWLRVIRPLRHLRRPWRVDEVIPERGNAWTIVMSPVGHPGFGFEPGQFGWVLVGQNPFLVTQHPFSFSSSAEQRQSLTMTIKARGDFTDTIRDVAPGTRAYVDGPYGLFSADRYEGPGYVFIAGGVGITPLISILRTLKDRKDVRPCLLVYGNRDWETVTFREELGAMATAMPLTVVHVLEEAPPGWKGETGYVTADMLRRHLPDRFERLQYFVCGPVPMMDAMEGVLSGIGVPDERIHTERFDMV